MENNINNLFITASRNQLRFKTARGPVTVEDLWSFGLPSLDTLAVEISKSLQAGQTTFLAAPSTKSSDESRDNQLRLEILKYVITTKQDEAKAAHEATAKRSQLAFLKGLLDSKRMESLAKLTEAEIEAQIATLS